jgi:predicted small secreted protein
MKKYIQFISILIVTIMLIFLLAACSNAQDGAIKAIEAYIQALSNKDATQISVLSCADWEQDALLEVDSLSGVNSKVENLTCQQAGQEGADTYVSCTGVLVLDYNGEAQQIDLSARTYIARQEDGDWRMCGYH